MIYTLKPDNQGYLVIDNKNGLYKPGDVLQFSGNFKAVAIYNLSGTAEAPIKITNVAGEKLTIGDPLWTGGAWAHGLAIRNSNYLEVIGTDKISFIINASTSNTIVSGNAPARTAYLNLMIAEICNNIKVRNLTIKDGGVGVVCKAYRNGDTVLDNFEFDNLEIYGTYNEAFYIGDTSSSPDSSGKYPIKLNNVKVHHCLIHDVGNDGIQIAAADNVEVYNNEVLNWGVKKEMAHSGGILIGGRVKGFYVHHNNVHDGFGNMLQIFAEGGVNDVVKNNIFSTNKLDGIYVRGSNNLAVQFENNTVQYAGENVVRVNGIYGGTKVELNKNILAGPLGGSYTGQLYPKNWIYTENGGVAVDNDNIRTVKGSDIAYVGYGYQVPAPIPDPVPEPPKPELKVDCELIVKGRHWWLYEDGTSKSSLI